MNKTPSYLYQVFQSDSESDNEAQISIQEEKVAPIDDTVHCFLCGDQQKCGCDLLEVLEASEYTFSDVLSKLFSGEQLPDSLAEKNYSQGLLCTYCTYLVSDLFRLHRELKTVKNVIVRTFKSSENKDVKGVSNKSTDNETATRHKITNGRKRSRDTDRAEKVKYKKSINHERKRGNKGKDATQKRRKLDGVKPNRKYTIGKEESKSKVKRCIGETDELLKKEKKKSIELKGLKNKDSYHNETKPRNVVEEDSAYTTDDEKDTDDEPVYNIEAILSKAGSTYLVKWENYPDDQNTWEPRSSIPDLVVQYYEEDISRVGKSLPSDFARFEDDIHEEDDDEIWKPESFKQTPKDKQSCFELKQKEIKRKRRENQSTGDSKHYFVRSGGQSDGGGQEGGIKRKLFSEPAGPQILQ